MQDLAAQLIDKPYYAGEALSGPGLEQALVGFRQGSLQGFLNCLGFLFAVPFRVPFWVQYGFVGFSKGVRTQRIS